MNSNVQIIDLIINKYETERVGSGYIFSPYLAPVTRLSVSVRGRRRRDGAWSVLVGPAGLLAPGLLLGPTLDSLVPLRRTVLMLTLAGVPSTLLEVWSGSVSGKQSDAKIRKENSSLACIDNISAFFPVSIIK